MVILKKTTPSLGFGLIELIVSLSIVTIVTGIVVAKHNAFNGAILLRNQAYEIAFVIREAQQLAVSGQTTALTTTQKQRYGVAFSTAPNNSSNSVVNRQTMVLYKDKNTNGLYDGTGSSGDELIKTYRLDSRFEIVGLVDPGSSNSRGSMRVLFERPFFDAKFFRDNGTAVNTGPITITVRPVAPTSQVVPERLITVSSAGQVEVPSN
jgi:Tfp pilus assembly protein FimT